MVLVEFFPQRIERREIGMGGDNKAIGLMFFIVFEVFKSFDFLGMDIGVQDENVFSLNGFFNAWYE